MADNANRPSGLKPVGNINGGTFVGHVGTYFVPSTDGTAIGLGDPVVLGGTAGAAGTVVYGVSVEGMPTVARAVAGSTPVGVVVGFSPNQSDLSVKHRAASTARLVYVADDPNLIMEVQEDSLVSGIAVAEIGEGADLVMGTVNATTGNGETMLDSSTHATTATTVRILRLVPRPNNEIGDGGITDKRYAKFYVTWIEHQFKSTAAI